MMCVKRISLAERDKNPLDQGSFKGNAFIWLMAFKVVFFIQLQLSKLDNSYARNIVQTKHLKKILIG